MLLMPKSPPLGSSQPSSEQAESPILPPAIHPLAPNKDQLRGEGCIKQAPPPRLVQLPPSAERWLSHPEQRVAVKELKSSCHN